MKNKKPKTKSDVDVIVEVLKDSKEFEKFLTDMENAYQNYEFCERNYIDPDEYGWWLEWVENIPNKFYVKLAKSILQKLKENRKEIAKEVEQKEGNPANLLKAKILKFEGE